MVDEPKDVEENGDSEDGRDVDFPEWVEDVFDIRTIRNPYHEHTVMAIATVGPRAIMGGIVELGDGMMPVYQPLMFAEVPIEVDEVTKQIKAIGPQFTKHFMLIQTLDWMMFRVDSLYILKANRPTDMALVEQYEKAVKVVQAQDSDIEIIEEMPSDLLPDNVRPLGRN